MSARALRNAVKDKRKTAKTRADTQKNKLLSMWKEQWALEEWDEHLDAFFRLFPEVYQYVYYSKEDNKQKNMLWKNRFIRILSAEFILYAIFFTYTLLKHNNNFDALFKNGLAMIFLIFLSGIIAKWIDIKKYQETWARHSLHLHMMEAEMLRYISYIAPYNNINRKIIFVKRILKIWDKNEKKFVRNMEDKEKELMDLFSRFLH